VLSDRKALGWPGVSHELEVVTDGLLALARSGGVNAPKGTHYFKVDLGNGFRARTWASTALVSIPAEPPAWSDATFAWNAVQANAPWLPVGDADGAELRNVIALEQPPANDLVEGFGLDGDTLGLKGIAASEALGIGFADARFAKGLEVRDTTRVAWPLSVPAAFSATFDLRFDELLEEPQVYLVWSGGSGALSLGYDPNVGIYYLEDHLGNRVGLTLAGRRHLKCPEGKIRDLPRQTGGSEMEANRIVVGVDTAKRVFQLYRVDRETGEIVDLRLTRSKFLEHFANRAPCVVGMEAYGGSQHWARRLRELGHEVRLLPARQVRSFVAGNKSDAHDARAIWTAMRQPGVKTVAIKSEEQQAILALHRMRRQLVKFRTARINGLRGLPAEYGEVMTQGRAGIGRGIAAALERVSRRLPTMVVEALREQWARVARLDEEIGEIERRLAAWHRDNDASRRIAEIPGVGVLGATAVVAAMGDPGTLRLHRRRSRLETRALSSGGR